MDCTSISRCRLRTPYEAGLLFCQIVATVVAQKHPKIATVERSVRARGPRVYVDYLQNVLGKTLATAYSARASQYAGVSAPLTWKEVDAGIRREDFTIKTMTGRVKKVGDRVGRSAERQACGSDAGDALSDSGRTGTAVHVRPFDAKELVFLDLVALVLIVFVELVNLFELGVFAGGLADNVLARDLFLILVFAVVLCHGCSSLAEKPQQSRYHEEHAGPAHVYGFGPQAAGWKIRF